MWRLVFLLCAVPVWASCPLSPLVIAHRGASGDFPEHTEMAYWQAMQQGADFIEADLVPTRDGVLISRHENELSQSTNVAMLPQFASRKSRKTVDGVEVEGWFSEDFTLAEIRQLKARESKPEIRKASATFNDQFAILTLAEIMQLVQRYQQSSGRVVGLYLETKHPTYFKHEGRLQSGQLIGIDISELLLQQLSQWQLSAKNPVYIQSFEMSNLWWMRQHGLSRYQVSAQLVQLIGDVSGTALYPASNFAQPWDMVYGKPVHGLQMQPILQQERFHYGDLLTDAGLQFLASYVDGIGPWKEQWYQHNTPMVPIEVTRQLKLQVHPYTFRAEANFLPKDVVDLNAELQQRFRQGVDGVFTDHTRIAVEARQAVCR